MLQDFQKLTAEDKTITKRIEVFNLDKAVKKVVKVLSYEFKLQNVRLGVVYDGFQHLDRIGVNPEEFLVKTDKRRIQSVIYQLASYVISLSTSEAKVTFLVEYIPKAQVYMNS
jgi:signal transduction histidine kinase